MVSEAALAEIAMRHHTFFPLSEYKRRAELRREYEQWLATIDFDFHVTLSFPQNTRIATARPMLSHWFARIDNYYLGRAWSRRSSAERTDAIAFPENIHTNLHHHCLLRLPKIARGRACGDAARVLQRAWARIAPRGTCDVAPIDDIAGAARYVVKQVVRPGYLDHYIVASEFHFHRPRHGTPSAKP